MFALGALLIGCLPRSIRLWVLLIGSVIAIYVLQPDVPSLRRLDYVLPTAALLLSAFCWWWTLPQRQITPEDRLTFVIAIGVILMIAGTRLLAPEWRIVTAPPDPIHVAIVLAGIVLPLAWIARRIRLGWAILGIIGLFIALKVDPIAMWIAGLWRGVNGQDVSLATPVELEWIGFSYLAFRLIHTLRDRQTGQLPALSLREYLTYALFFPAYTAGPIDRAERFVQDYRALPPLDLARLQAGGERIAIGLFKKFVIADTLAVIALNSLTVTQAESAWGLWVLLYAYAFRLYFDFSGYTDIAIGIGMLYGINLPENFDRPYLKHNITLFWQSWHITLSSWVRFYVFSPLSRAMLTRQRKPPTWVILLTAHLITMILIGLWHDVTGPFLMWGIWHGIALFLHKQWSDRTRRWYQQLKTRPWRLRAWHTFGLILTFHYVTLGWVWFALPDLGLAFATVLRLFGGG
jgi:alginate O-acetyltransferase complex protein AlgI